ncbi:MAG TPA: Gfo/Idh/MocA family oxidoreductase [Verrucomicrobiae bacterium]|nr:Gfo/Idh/MocA family oxidoreductase [Verrucomicrobiae bacterium]
MNDHRAPGTSRRHFIKSTAAAAAALAIPMFVPGCAVGHGKRARPSNRITLGVVGWGMQGPGNTQSFLHETDCQVVAACDLDKLHLQSAVDTINGHYQNKDCKAYHDYREMFARDDIDAVMLAVPDNWHALMSIDAARAKKDIYGEKPLARTIAEQQAIVRACQKNNIIWQTGSWQRSQALFRKAAEIVRSGLIGRVHRVEVGLPSGHNDFARSRQFMEISEPPPELDYERWIGPSQMEPYIRGRVHMNWRWNYNIGGGQLLDWIGHHCDIAHWGLDFDRSGPSEIEGEGEFPPRTAVWNTCTKYRVEMKYPDNITMIVAGGHSDIRGGTKWIGDEGWVWVNRGGFDTSNPDWKQGKNLAEELRKVKLYESPGHQRDFLDCVKSRKPPITPVETAHHSAVPGHLGLISMLVGRKIRWNVKSEKIIDDAEATKLLTRPYRAPWKLA